MPKKRIRYSTIFKAAAKLIDTYKEEYCCIATSSANESIAGYYDRNCAPRQVFDNIFESYKRKAEEAVQSGGWFGTISDNKDTRVIALLLAAEFCGELKYTIDV